MPLYEYKCSNCGAVFEILQKINDPPLKKCIRCRGTVKKLLSPPALQFKGNGWYITDYASKGKQAPESTDTAKPEKEKEPPKDKKPTSPPSSEKK